MAPGDDEEDLLAWQERSAEEQETDLRPEELLKILVSTARNPKTPAGARVQAIKEARELQTLIEERKRRQETGTAEELQAFLVELRVRFPG